MTNYLYNRKRKLSQIVAQVVYLWSLFPPDKSIVMFSSHLVDYWNWLFLKPIHLYNELQKLYIK